MDVAGGWSRPTQPRWNHSMGHSMLSQPNISPYGAFLHKQAISGKSSEPTECFFSGIVGRPGDLAKSSFDEEDREEGDEEEEEWSEMMP